MNGVNLVNICFEQDSNPCTKALQTTNIFKIPNALLIRLLILIFTLIKVVSYLGIELNEQHFFFSEGGDI